MSTQLAPAAATLPRQERAAALHRTRRGRSVDAPEPTLVRREQPPASADELERQAQQIIRELDSVRCDVRTTPYPVNNGLRKEPVRRTVSGQSTGSGFSSLDRVALKALKNNKNGVKSRSTNTLPTAPQKAKVVDSDHVKNNLIKAESLKRGKAGQFASKKVGDLAKPIGGSTQHLNNVNLLKDEAMGGRHRRGSESGLVNGIHHHGNKVFSKHFDDEDIDPPRTLHHPIKRLSSSDRDSYPRVVDSSSQTPSGFSPVPGGGDVIYTQVITGPERARPEVPPRPERQPVEPYRPRGFSYIGRRDADLIERAQTVEDRSRYIIEKIARQRSRSPAYKSGWTSQRVSGSMSPPPPVLPPGETGEVRRGRYGSSIVQIGGEEAPPPRPPPPVEPPHYTTPRNSSSGGSGGSGGQQHYSVPRKFSSNVIRLSVSGSHTSSGDGSPTERRRSQSHEATPPPALHAPRSRSSSPERYFYGERRPAEPRPVTRVTEKRQAPRRPSREPSAERHRQHNSQISRKVNGHVTREVSGGRDGARPGDATTLERQRRREQRAERGGDRSDRERSSESPNRQGDNKKRIKIKFIYDATRDEPSDARLARYTEYRGSDEADSASPTPDTRSRHDVVQIAIQDGHRLKQEKMLRQRDKFLAHFLESGRPEPSERRDGRRISPPHQSYDKDLHGVWSSLDEEDQIIARQQRSEKNVKRGGAKLNNHLLNGRDRQRSSLSSEDDRVRHSSREDDRVRHSSRERSTSPERVEKPKKRGWLSSTLSRLDFKSRRHPEARRTASTESGGSSTRPVARAPSQPGPRPPLRRQARSASRDSRSGSREPAPRESVAREVPRRPPGRTPSFSQRYFGESDGTSGGEGGRRPVRRPSGGGSTAAAHSLPSSANSSDGPVASRVSAGSGRSVFLHATTVADIPPPSALEQTAATGSRANLAAPLPARERRKVARSFSLVAPFRPKNTREKEIVYENQTGQANGRPPRPPQRVRRDSRDSQLDEPHGRPVRKRQPVTRSVSMPKDARPAGFFRSREKTPR
ncbi:serine/arginine repetitive matrix protein 1-like [Amphibalanus amphitrite]|uniref:serine/arginine repetitive matrix protein 1-like n=1 Tax=Amphibalanus amphitrite TaxID=1232801 RepID=UPI001C917100|nr:serine/arginine repetitive matrix protein 1-like [Amphibalanus amphitrite]XP_043245404.1 serine/arginine repetitive matrix protein 1-like [Amphibalanus amphitrite]